MSSFPQPQTQFFEFYSFWSFQSLSRLLSSIIFVYFVYHNFHYMYTFIIVCLLSIYVTNLCLTQYFLDNATCIGSCLIYFSSSVQMRSTQIELSWITSTFLLDIYILTYDSLWQCCQTSPSLKHHEISCVYAFIHFAWKVPTTALLILHQLGSASILSIFILCLQNNQQTAHSERSLGSELLESRNSMVVILQTNSVV